MQWYKKCHQYAPKSSESHVDVSVPVTFVANVDADSVDVLIVVSAVDAIDDPITITYICGLCKMSVEKIYLFDLENEKKKSI